MFKNKNEITGARGFTLMELLLSSLILSVVLIGVYASFRAGMLGYKGISDSLALQQDAVKLFDRLEADLKGAFAYSEEKTYFSGATHALRFLALTNVYENQATRTAVSLVSYELSGTTLLRLCRNNKESLNEKSLIQPDILVTRVKSFSLNYGYQASPESPVKFDKEDWKDEKELPKAVRVTAELEGAPAQQFTRTIFIPLAYEK